MTRRILTWAGVGAVLIAVLLAGTAAWRFSDDLRDELLIPTSLREITEVEVVAIGTDTVTLAASDAAGAAGAWGLTTATSFGRIGDVLESTDATVTRSYASDDGQLEEGPASIDRLALRGDPKQALGISFDEVLIDGELGQLPAWYLDGSAAVWLIFVHGAEGRGESLPVLPVADELGLPALVVSYRNDPGAPASADGLTTWGFDEWRDVDTAIEYAFSQGATGVYLMGSGAGGSAVTLAVQESEHVRSILGVILDSATLDLRSVEEARRPDAGLIGSWGRSLASWRFGVEWTRLDHAVSAGDIRRPVLLLHGVDDSFTPLAVADRFAAEMGELVEYHQFPGAGHGETWNVDGDRFVELVADFLVKHIPVEG